MKISAWIFATDLLLRKQSVTEKLISKKNLFKNSTVEKVFAQLKASGFDGIELSLPANFCDTDFKQIKNILDDNKVIVNSIHQPLRWFSKTDFKEIKILFKYAKQFNAKIIVLHLLNAKEQIFNRDYLESLHKLQEDYGIKLSFENTQKFAQINNKKRYYDGKIFSDVVKKAGFSITFDTTHLADAGGNIIAFFNENKDSIVNIQLSDYRAKWPRPCLHLIPGEGTLPLRELLKVIKQNKYDKLITMEIKTDLEGICESVKFIKRYLN